MHIVKVRKIRKKQNVLEKTLVFNVDINWKLLKEVLNSNQKTTKSSKNIFNPSKFSLKQ